MNSRFEKSNQTIEVLDGSHEFSLNLYFVLEPLPGFVASFISSSFVTSHHAFVIVSFSIARSCRFFILLFPADGRFIFLAPMFFLSRTVDILRIVFFRHSTHFIRVSHDATPHFLLNRFAFSVPFPVARIIASYAVCFSIHHRKRLCYRFVSFR